VLALTDKAAEAVKVLVSAAAVNVGTSGLRVVAEPVDIGTNFELSIATLPAEDDEVVEESGARVFLEPNAAALLDDKVLDAELAQNQVSFTIADQADED
jgi:iron-sulfur cluster assembly protein